MKEIALGVDRYKRGWVGVVFPRSGLVSVLVDPALETLLARVPDASCIGIDMPIGLPAVERPADSEARKYVGRRRSSIFRTPPRQVLDAPSHGEANAVAPTIMGGKKISHQAWALRNNIWVVEAVAAVDTRVIEVHSEVSFRAMNGAEVEYFKSTWNGQALCRRCLQTTGIVLEDQLDEGGGVPVADVLDAAAAWSAMRYAENAACSFPASASPGQREVIWY